LLSKQNKSNNSKCFAFASFAILLLFFTTNSAAFVGGGATIFLPPGAGYPSYVTGGGKDLEKLGEI